MEHLQHFGLSRDPFCNEPLPELFLEVGPHRDALLRLDRAVRQRRGLCVLTGAVGSGKTMAARQLLERLEEEVFEANMMVVLNASADARWIFTRLARSLEIEEPADDEGIVAQVYERLAIIREEGRHAVLLVDDAEALVAGRALADVCSLLKLEYEDRRLLTLVLCGGPPLAQALADEPGLSERVEVRVEMEPLDAATAHQYLSSRIQSSGGAVAILHEEAMDAIHELGGGLPGRMNTLADNALFEAFLAQRRQMTREDVERAYADLGWGPAGAPLPPRKSSAAPMAAPAPAPQPVAPAPVPPLAAPAPAPVPPLAGADLGASASGEIDLEMELAEAAAEVEPEIGLESPLAAPEPEAATHQGSLPPATFASDPEPEPEFGDGDFLGTSSSALQQGGGDHEMEALDSELDAAFAIGPEAGSSGSFGRTPSPDGGAELSFDSALKDESGDDLLVELIEE